MKKIILNMLPLVLLTLGCSGSNSGSSSPTPTPPPGPARSYVYALGNGSTTIFGYSVSSSGAMTAINTTTVSAGYIGINLRAAPSKKFLYATVNAGPQYKLVALEVNQATGATTLVAGGAANLTDNDPRDLVIHPNSRIAYIPDSTGNRLGIFTLDATTGIPTAAGTGASGAGTAPTGVAIHPNGNYLYVAENGATVAVTVYSINTTTGGLAATGSTHLPGGASLYKAAISPDGKWLYASSDTDIHVYSVDATTGAITFVESKPLLAGTDADGDSLTVDGSNKYLYVSSVPNTAGGTLKTFSINQTTGALTLVETVTPTTAVAYSEVVADQVGSHVFLVDITSGNLYSFNINATTGSLTAGEEEAVAGGDPYSVTTLYFPP